MQETPVPSLGLEDPLEKGMATQSPVFLPGKPHGQRSLAGYNLRGRRESDMTEQLTLSLFFFFFPTFNTSQRVLRQI